MKIPRPAKASLIRYFQGQSLPGEEKLVDLYLSMEIDQTYVQSCMEEAWNQLAEEPDTQLLLSATPTWQQFLIRREGLRQLPSKRRFPWYGYAAAAAVLAIGILLIWQSPRKEISYRSFTAAAGHPEIINLEDGTKAMLFPGSVLEVANDYNQQGRKLRLHGRAFFDVAHQANNTFTVTTGQLVTRDIGTRFEINNQTITLQEGKISVSEAGKELAQLQPNQSFIYKNHQFQIQTVNTQTTLSWINGELTYDLAPLSDICGDIEKWYNVQITITDPALQKKKITTSFKDMPLKEVMDMLSLTGRLTYTIHGNQITIR